MHCNLLLCSSSTKMVSYTSISSVILFSLPQSVYDVLGNFRAVIARANEVPPRKFVCPQTEGQEYGWVSQPLVCTLAFLLLMS